MSFAAPLWLLALVPLAIVAAALWRSPAVAGGGVAPFVLRAVAAVALVVALAQPHLGAAEPTPTVLVLDRSASIDATMTARETAWVRAAIAEHACADPCRVVEFAGTAAFAGLAATAAPGSSGATAGSAGSSGATAGATAATAATTGSPTATDLAAALRLATGALPDGGRAIVLTDGHPTTGDTTAAAAAAARRGVQVEGVALTAGRRPADAAVTRLEVPSPVHDGDALTLQATVRTTVAGPATLVLTRDGEALGRQAVTLRRGDNPFAIPYRAAPTGWHAYRLEVRLDGDDDRLPANDALDATARVGPPPRVLIAEGAPGRAGALPTILAADGIAARTTTPADLPAAAPALGRDDVIVLAHVPAPALGAAQVRALETAVRAGAGLLVLGGPHSLSLGRYADTPLDRLLPVQSLRPGGLRRRRLALQLVIDRSSSMNDPSLGSLDPKIVQARSAAKSVLALAARDEAELGLVAFDAEPHVLLPLQRVTAGNAGAVAQQLDTLDADGGTNLLRGLEAGEQQLRASRAPVKHLLLAGDGVSEPADYGPLVARLRRDKVTLSTVALGVDADTRLLRRLARATGGRFYAVPDASRLPRVFAQEARRSAPSVAVRGRLAVSAGAASPLLADLTDRALPPLAGTVVTRLRDGAIAPLTTDVNGATTPVLAQWTVGLGRVVVWTPGLGEWAGTWPSTRPAAFTAATRWSARAVATPALEPALDPADRTRLVVDPLATAGTPDELAGLAATLRTPADATRPLAFAQDAPSRYVASLGSDPPAGVYGVGVAQDGDGPTATQALIAVPYPAELRPTPDDTSVLGAVAAATGGTLHPADDPVALLRPDAGAALWRVPAIVALVALLAAAALSASARGARRRGRAPRPG